MARLTAADFDQELLILFDAMNTEKAYKGATLAVRQSRPGGALGWAISRVAGGTQAPGPLSVTSSSG
jgi:hypothetical protein